MRSVAVNGIDESHRVATKFKNKLVTIPSPGIETLYDVAKHAFDTVRRVFGVGHIFAFDYNSTTFASCPKDHPIHIRVTLKLGRACSFALQRCFTFL